MSRKLFLALFLLTLLLAGCMGGGTAPLPPQATPEPPAPVTPRTAPKMTPTPQGDEGGASASSFDLSIGDCFNETGDADNIEVEVVPCDEPHENEVFHQEDLPDGKFPGDSEASAAADALCVAAFEGYTGESYDESALYISFYYPSKGTWANGDREVACILHADGELLTGSMAGSGGGDSPTGGTTTAFDLAVGDCFDYDSETGEVTIQACTDPHDFEVFHLEDITDSDFPGDEATQQFADSVCEASFEDYVGVPYAESPLYITSLYPTEGTWANGDREVVCLLTGDDEPLVGSMQGASTGSSPTTIMGTSDLAVGECFNKPSSPDEGISLVDCAEPHDHEVYHIEDMVGESFPGDDEAGIISETLCVAQFESYVGVDYDASTLSISYIYPTAESWGAGDREVVCLLRESQGQLVGSMEGSGR